MSSNCIVTGNRSLQIATNCNIPALVIGYGVHRLVRRSVPRRWPGPRWTSLSLSELYITWGVIAVTASRVESQSVRDSMLCPDLVQVHKLVRNMRECTFFSAVQKLKWSADLTTRLLSSLIQHRRQYQEQDTVVTLPHLGRKEHVRRVGHNDRLSRFTGRFVMDTEASGRFRQLHNVPLCVCFEVGTLAHL